MRYEIGKLVAVKHGSHRPELWVTLSGVDYLVANENEIPEDERVPGRHHLFCYLPDNQYATYIPMDRVRWAFQSMREIEKHFKGV